MNLTEEKKAPLRAWDMPMKRNMLTMQVTAGKVAACSELLVWDLYWHYFLNIQSINFLLIYFFPPIFLQSRANIVCASMKKHWLFACKKNRTIYNWWLNHWNIFVAINTVNQLLFTTFFCDLHKMNWLIAIDFREQALSTPVFVLQLYNKYRSTVRNILNSWNLTKISHIRIKVGLQ